MRNKIQLSLFLTLLILGVQGKFASVFANPSVEFTYSGICIGSPTQFTVNNTITNVSNVTIWSWNFGDGLFSSIQDPAHTYAGPGDYLVTLTIKDIFGKTGIVAHHVIIQQLPVVNFAYTTPGCSSDSIQFTDLSSTANGYISRWIWSFDDGSPNKTILFPGDPNPKHVFPGPGTFDVTLSVMNTELCVNQIPITVTVSPSPVANFHFNGRCEDQAVTFTDASSANGAGNIVAWNWDFGDSGSGVDNLSNLTDPSHIFTNAGTYSIKLTVTNFNSCTDTISKQVTINQHLPVEYTNSATCLNELTFFTPDPLITNIPSIAFWLWDFGDGVTSNATNASHKFTSSASYPVTLTITDLLGCTNVVSHPVDVDPLPVAQFSSNLSDCAGASVQFHNQSTSTAGFIAKWHWDFGDGTTITVNHPANPDVSHVYATAGIYNIVLSVTTSNGCSKSKNHLITIHPNPVADFDFTQACINTPVDFTDLSQANGSGSIIQWQWAFGDSGSGILNNSALQNPDHAYVTAGSYTVQLIVTSGSGCSDTLTRTLLVNPAPPVNFNTTNNCQNNSVIFNPDALVINFGSVSSWFWEFGNGSTSGLRNPVYVYSTAGTYNVKLTIVDNKGCSNTIIKPISILPQPSANFSYSQPACDKSIVTFNNLSSASAGVIIKSEWNFGDGIIQSASALASVSHTYTSSATFLVTLTVTTSDSCKRSISLPVSILRNPLANFSFQNTCLNSQVQFDDLSQAGSGGLASWSWNFGDNASASNISALQDPAHVYNTAGTFQVTLIVSNSGGCSDTIVKPLLVHGLPVVDFTSSPGCINDSTKFVSSTFVNAGAVVSRLWNFGDGFISLATDPSHIYTSSGSYTVTLTVTDTAGCINSKSHTVSTIQPPLSSFQVSAQTCSNNSVLFTDYSSSSVGTIISRFWEFGDGSDTLIMAPATGNISHIYVAGSTYTASLTIYSSTGCKAKSQRTVSISASPIAQFNFNNTCEGAAVNFNDLSVTNAGTSIINWSWNFGDAGSGTNTSNLKNPLHTYITPGTYTVSLLVQNASGCTATVSKTLVVNPKPSVDFSWASTCVGNSSTFTTNTFITNVAAVTSYDWNFGDGTAHNTTQQNPAHTYATAGDFIVTLTITNTSGCKNIVSHSVRISPKPNASFSLTNVCAGTSAQFTDQSISSSGVPISAWHWDYGVNTLINDTSSQQNPSWNYSAKGIYSVKLTVTTQNGCQDEAIRSIQVYGKPTADFSYTASPCDNGAVSFLNTSFSQQATIVSSGWEFEPGNYSSLQNPLYVFYAPDSCYDVRLIATDIRGCIDTIVKEVCVPAEFNFTFTTSTACIKDSTYFTPQLIAPLMGSLVFFKWNFGDESSGIYNTSSKNRPSHFYSRPGTYTISLLATDINNCTKTIYKSITIFPLPVPWYSYTAGVCDSTIYFNESSTGNGSNISKWIWDFGDGVTNTVFAPNSPDLSHHYKSPGTYIVGLKVTNANGCTNTFTDKNIQVKPCISAAFELLDKQVCQNNTLTFTDNSFSALTANEWYWDFGDGTYSVYNTFTNRVDHVFKISGAFTVRLIFSTLVSGRKVSDTAQMIVNVNPTPLPDFTFGVVCNEQSAVFTNMTSGSGTKIVSYNWSFGEPASAPHDTSTSKNPVHLYKAPGTYEVQLKAQNIIGCRDSIQKILVINGLPAANFKSALSCVGSNTSFSDLSINTGTPIVNWKWTFKDNMGLVGEKDIQNPFFVFKKTGDYSVNLRVTDANGCYDTLMQYISTWDTPQSIFTFTDNLNDVQGQLQMNNTSVDANKYHWTFGNGEDSYAEKPVALYPNEGTYDITLIALNDKGCSDTLSMQYKFMVKGLYIPNAFSPLNPLKEVQLLKPVGTNLQQYRFEVYDRWGNLLWWTDKLDSAGQPTEGWDGRFKDVLLPQGAYVWKAFGVFLDGSIWEAENIGNSNNLPRFKTGTATMIR